METKTQKQRSDLAKLVFTMLAFGTIGLFRRNIPLSSSVIALARGAVGAAFLAVYMKARGKALTASLSRKTLGLLIVTGMMMGINWMILFEAYNYTSISAATLFYYMQPTLLIIGSAIVFKEHLPAKKWILAGVSFAGMFLVSGLMTEGLPPISEAKGMGLAFAAAVLYAVIVMINKQMDRADPYEKTFVQLASAAAVMVPYILLTEDLGSVSITPTTGLLLLFIGVFHTGFCYALYFGCIGSLKSQTIAIFSYVDPITALILAALILHESMDLFGIIGSVLIIGSALLNEL